MESNANSDDLSTNRSPYNDNWNNNNNNNNKNLKTQISITQNGAKIHIRNHYEMEQENNIQTG